LRRNPSPPSHHAAYLLSDPFKDDVTVIPLLGVSFMGEGQAVFEEQD
jgi:hypothetical protein